MNTKHPLRRLPWSEGKQGRAAWEYRGWKVTSTESGNGWRGRTTHWHAEKQPDGWHSAYSRAALLAAIDADEDNRTKEAKS